MALARGGLETIYNLLLANRQIFRETHEIAYARYYEDFSQIPQLYNICLKNERRTMQTPVQEWEIRPDHVWQPKCHSVEAFAASRLPTIRLNIWPLENGERKKEWSKLQRFLQSLATELAKANATASVGLYLPVFDKAHWSQLLKAIKPVTRISKSCDIIITSRIPLKQRTDEPLRSFCNDLSRNADTDTRIDYHVESQPHWTDAKRAPDRGCCSSC